MKSVALIDLVIPGKKANRDHTGGFGSFMQADGITGHLLSKMKSKLVELPVLHFGYIASLFRQKGWIVNFYSSDFKGEDFVFIASSMHCHLDEIEYAKRLKKQFPNSKIGFFGPFVISNPHFFEQVADFLIFGEVESAVQAFFESKCNFEGRLDFGIVKNLDSLPFPDWSSVDIKKYNYFPLLHKRPFISMQSSRGCSFNCNFCPYMVEQTKNYRRRSPHLVVDEIEKYVTENKVKSILFRDICFTLNKNHAESIAKEIIQRKIKIEWACETRVDCLTTELIDVMYESGLRGINFGIETGNLEILKESGKRSPTLELQRTLLKYLSKKGIRVNAFYMLGLVGDTPSTMKETMEFAASLNTMGAQFCTMTPFPGTSLFEEFKDRLLSKDFTDFNEYQPVADIQTSSPDEVKMAAAQAYRYYLRFPWIVKHGFKTLKRLVQNLLWF